MAQPVIQTAFTSGEWAPNLNARVDVAKYHTGAALLENFYVDYRGGATASPGSKYIYQCLSGTNAVRLIPFQASLAISYILVFENLKLYFLNNGVPVVETAKTITGITKANPGVVTHGGGAYVNGDRVFITGVAGMTQVNGNYYTVAGATGTTFQLADLAGNLINTNVAFYSAYTSGGTVARVYTIASPYASTELNQIKYAQDVNIMAFCHPNYTPYILTLIGATNWTLAPIVIGPTIPPPTAGLAFTTTLTTGTWHYAYRITSVDVNGQESSPSALITNTFASPLLDLRTTPGTNTLQWTGVTGAVSYNIYKALPRQAIAISAGTMFGFIGNTTSTTFYDSNYLPDFSINSPIVTNPFSGTGVQSVVMGVTGSYAGLGFPAVTFTPVSGGTGATGFALIQATGVTVAGGGGSGGGGVGAYLVGDVLGLAGGLFLSVTAVASGGVTAVSIANPGSISGGTIPANNLPVLTHSRGIGNPGVGTGATFTVTWGVTGVTINTPGLGYLAAPTVSFSTGAATATATTGTAVTGNPTVPAFHQQRLFLMGLTSSPNQINASNPSAIFNFNVSDPILASDAFQGTLNSGQLNTIQSAISQPQGLIILTDRLAWLINGGSPGAAFNAIDAVANAQIFNGSSSPPPLIAVDDILYIQAKNSIVRDLIFNYSKQVYTGADISVQSSHLFFGYQILEWAFAEEPCKLVWAVRNDGILLCLTFLREQEMIAWTHRVTEGSYKSIASITETSLIGNVDAVYTVVQRSINGVIVQYIERFVEQFFPTGATNAWQVDAGLRYDGASTLSFTGAQHLAGATVTGLATDNTGRVTVITPFVVATTGAFTLPAPASPATGYTRVVVGIAYTPKFKTLGIDTGNPTIQGKMKKLPEVTVRVANTLGLQIGTDFDNLVDMEDLIVGNVGKNTNEVVLDLVTGDAKQALDPAWTVPGQYCIQQSLPYPATILGLIPQIAVGDTPK